MVEIKPESTTAVQGARATILVVEDDPGVLRLQQRLLQRAGYEVVTASTADEAMAKVRQFAIDLILLDYKLTVDQTGLEFYETLKTAGYDVPVIMVTGFSDEATVIKALRAGVRDFVTKSTEYLDYLPEAAERVLRQVATERRLAESEARLTAIIDSAKDAIITVEADQRISLFNPAAEQMFGCSAARAVGQPLGRFIPKELHVAAEEANGQADLVSLTHQLRMGSRGVRANGEAFPLEASVSHARIGGRKLYTIVARDVTERNRAEEARKRSEEAARESEARKAAVFESVLDALITMDHEGKIVEFNQAAETIFAFSKSEVIGKDLADLIIPPRLRGKHRQGLTHYLATGEGPVFGKRLEMPAVRADGSEFPVELTVTRIANREPALFTGYLRDISERKRTEERIRQQAAFLDKARDAIIVKDLQGCILYWNQGAERLYGWQAAEAIGQKATALLYKGTSAKQEEALRTVLETGEWVGELEHVTRAGKKVIVESRWTLLRDDEGKPKAKLVINTDVTEKKKLETQYLRAQRMESLGTLAGGIAHDLNNVLTPIVMALDLLKLPMPEKDRASMLTTLQLSANRATEMVKQVLSFARGVDGARAPVQLKPVVKEIEKMLRHSLPKSVEIETSLPDDLCLISADATQLAQVLMNLCVNARDAMPLGGRLRISAENTRLDEHSARIHLEAKPGPYVLLKVADTGTGIPADLLEKIFDPFFTTKEVGKGTGLGLSTVLGIVKSHGGFVRVYSEVGKGTRFLVYLPAVEAAQPKQAERTAELPEGHGELILLVDDEVTIREITKATLEAHGYRVLTANDGIQAVALYTEHKGAVTAVLTDMMMPTMDGAATIRALHDLDPQVAIIAASGLSASGRVSDQAHLGVRAVLTKPYTAEKLLHTLRRIVRSQRRA